MVRLVLEPKAVLSLEMEESQEVLTESMKEKSLERQETGAK